MESKILEYLLFEIGFMYIYIYNCMKYSMYKNTNKIISKKKKKKLVAKYTQKSI